MASIPHLGALLGQHLVGVQLMEHAQQRCRLRRDYSISSYSRHMTPPSPPTAAISSPAAPSCSRSCLPGSTSCPSCWSLGSLAAGIDGVTQRRQVNQSWKLGTVGRAHGLPACKFPCLGRDLPATSCHLMTSARPPVCHLVWREDGGRRRDGRTTSAARRGDGGAEPGVETWPGDGAGRPGVRDLEDSRQGSLIWAHSAAKWRTI